MTEEPRPLRLSSVLWFLAWLFLLFSSCTSQNTNDRLLKVNSELINTNAELIAERNRDRDLVEGIKVENKNLRFIIDQQEKK